MTILETRVIAVPATAGRARALPAAHRAHRVLATTDVVAAVLVAAGISPLGLSTDLAVAFVPVWLMAVTLTGDYRLPGTVQVRARRLALAASVLPTLVIVASSAANRPVEPVLAAVLCLATAGLGLASRAGLATAARRGRPLLGLVHRVVAVGSISSVERLCARLGPAGRSRFQVIGACVADRGRTELVPGPVTHGLLTCVGLARACDADAVIVAPDPDLDANEVQQLQWALDEAGLDSFVWADVPAPGAGRTTLDLDGLALLHVGRPRRLGASHAVKRVLDRLVAVSALVVLAPLLAVLALAVRLDSEGPAFYRHTRVGKDDTRFTMWKLRTMTLNAAAGQAALGDANEGNGPLFKIRQDPRITRVGRWLRRTSLDELPQLINVALGQMSLVGPRPALPAEVERYQPEVRHRLVVHPGITGLWQVSGRSDLSWEESVRLDQRYVDDWSLVLDLRILVRTAKAVWSGSGAY